MIGFWPLKINDDGNRVGLVADIYTYLLLLFKLHLFLSWTDMLAIYLIQLECMQGLKISCDRYILPIGIYSYFVTLTVTFQTMSIASPFLKNSDNI